MCHLVKAVFPIIIHANPRTQRGLKSIGILYMWKIQDVFTSPLFWKGYAGMSQMTIQAYLEDIAGLVPDHPNKASHHLSLVEGLAFILKKTQQ